MPIRYASTEKLPIGNTLIAASNFGGTRCEILLLQIGPFWLRIAVVCSGVWIGVIVLYSLIRASDFPSFDFSYEGVLQAPFYIALTGPILILAICLGISWLEGARDFWKRVASFGSGIWLVATYLYSLMKMRGESYDYDPFSNFLNHYVLFALVGATLVFAVCRSVPWVMGSLGADRL